MPFTCQPPLKPYQNPTKNTNKSNKCLVYFLVILVLFCLILLVFASVLFKIKPPLITITSISVKSLRYDSSPSFNLTLNMNLSVINNNFGYFKLRDRDFNHDRVSFVTLVYGNMSIIEVGEANLGLKMGRVGARGKEDVRVRVEVGYVSEIEGRERVYNDLNSGYLELIGFATMNGKVHLLIDKIKKNSVGVMKCTIGIDLRNSMVKKLEC